MKLTIKRSELSAALGVVKTAATRGTLPILSHVSIVAQKNGIILTTTDLDLALRLRADATVKDEGKLTVRAHLLADIAGATTSEHIELALKGKTLHVTAAESKFELATMDHDEFPPFPRVKDPVEFTLSESDLRRALASTAFAMSTDEQRYVLNGSFLEFDGGMLTVVATDGRRLGLTSVSVGTKEKKAGAARTGAIVPNKTVKELLRLLKDNDESEVEISAGKAHIEFTFGETVIVSKLIEGDYPNFRQLMPVVEKNRCTPIARADLLGCVERVSLVADAATLELSGASLGIKSCLASDKKDVVGKAADALLCPCKQEVTVHLSTRYLTETLKASSAAELQFYAAPGGLVRFDEPARNWTGVIAGLKPANAKTETKPAEPAKPEPKKEEKK